MNSCESQNGIVKAVKEFHQTLFASTKRKVEITCIWKHLEQQRLFNKLK